MLFGPQMDNFAAIVGHLIEAGAARTVADLAALESEAAALFQNPAARASMAAAARTALARHSGATLRAVCALLNPL